MLLTRLASLPVQTLWHWVMDDAEDSPSARSAKRARLQDLDTSQLDGGSHSAEATVPASRQPAMHTKALRSVLKGAHSSAFVQLFVACYTVALKPIDLSLLYLQCLLSRQVSWFFSCSPRHYSIATLLCSFACLGNVDVYKMLADPNYAQPWQMRPQRSSSGSAFIVDTRRRHIMTNAHVVRFINALHLCPSLMYLSD